MAFLIVCVLVCGIGCRLGGIIAGVIAGVATALSPGMALFSNLLLAHLPCLLGLAAFLLGILTFIQRPGIVSGLVAGSGLSFAMLARPLTAASVGLPSGLWILMRGLGDVRRDRSRALRTWGWPALSLVLPLMAGFACLAVQSATLCGNPLRMAWSAYQRLCTPRHAFGFGNGARSDGNTSPDVLREYDNWAQNLDGALAWKNASERPEGSVNWGVEILPHLLGLILLVSAARSQSVQIWLIFLPAWRCIWPTFRTGFPGFSGFTMPLNR